MPPAGRGARALLSLWEGSGGDSGQTDATGCPLPPTLPRRMLECVWDRQAEASGGLARLGQGVCSPLPMAHSLPSQHPSCVRREAVRGAARAQTRSPTAAPLSPLRPAYPLASLMPAESYSEYVDRCAVSVRQMVSSCPQDGECAQVRAAPAGGAHRWDARRIVF